jgi:hypothetical protein
MSIARIDRGSPPGYRQLQPTPERARGRRLLAEKRIGALPVLDEGKVAGIFSERDLLYCVAREGAMRSTGRWRGDDRAAISIGPREDALTRWR